MSKLSIGYCDEIIYNYLLLHSHRDSNVGVADKYRTQHKVVNQNSSQARTLKTLFDEKILKEKETETESNKLAKATTARR